MKRAAGNLTLVPDTPPSRDAVPADISAPTDDTPQSPGSSMHGVGVLTVGRLRYG
jgi:hypothetical protein